MNLLGANLHSIRPIATWLAVLSVPCGACLIDADRPFEPTMECAEGSCDCLRNFGNCDGNADNGCETDLRSDPRHCGACGHSCVHSSCQAGTCVCDEGHLECDDDPTTICEADIARDPLHCGGCDGNCQGGQCLAGQCQPLVLADNLSSPAHLAISSGTAFYAVGSRTIVRSQLAAPGLPDTVLDTGAGVQDLAFDGQRVFWLSTSELWSVDPAFPDSPLFLAARAQAGVPLWDIALSATEAYVLHGSGDLMRVLKTGGDFVTIASEVTFIPVVGDHHLYWSTWGGQILRHRLSMGSAEIFEQGQFRDAQEYEGALYWLSAGTVSLLYRKREPEDAKEELAVLPFGYGLSLAVTDRGIFVSSSDAGTVQRFSHDGAESAIIARGQVGLHEMAAAGDFVYWLTDTRLMRLALLPGH